MIDPDQIPDEVVESAAKVIATVNEPIDKWLYHLPEARAAIAAAINAWPDGAVVGKYDNDDTALLLPLPHEEGEA